MNKTPRLLCYDICDPKRLRKVHRITSKTMISIQYSVFYAELSDAEAIDLLSELEAVIDVSHDKVHFYRIKSTEDHISIGPSLQSLGIYLFQESGLMH